MTPERQSRLFEQFPLIFIERFDKRSTLHSYGISCRDGWYALIERLCHDLQQLVDREHITQPVAVDVKEKLGKLKVHWRHPRRLDSRVLELTAQAQDRSCRVCDLCGAPGAMLSDGGWWRTRCAVHGSEYAVPPRGPFRAGSEAPAPALPPDADE